MIKDPEALERFEDRFIKDTGNLSYEQSLKRLRLDPGQIEVVDDAMAEVLRLKIKEKN